MNYKKTTLENGVRIITSEMPQMRSVATTVFVKAGSRYETPEINGISHFLEHMLFKGTKKYPGHADIAKAIEGVGGQLNAWTSEDHTAYYNQLPAEFAKNGLDVLAEMLFESTLADEAINRERGVIIEEINRRFDDPASYVFEILADLIWPDQPLGWPVIGNKENILKINRDDFLSYMGKLYSGKSIVVSVAGNIKHDDVVQSVEKQFSARISDAIKPEKAHDEQKLPKINIYHKKTDQAHLALGVRGLSYSDKDRFSWNLMNTILGQGMSSRLFLNIREDKGLAYHISSGTESYEDTGALVVHAGLNIKKLRDAIIAIREEFNMFRDELVDDKVLQRAKDFTKGMISLSMDDTENVSVWFGKQELLMPEVMNPDEVIEKYNRVTKEDIQRVAKRIFIPENLNLAVIGPVEDEVVYRALLS